MIKDITVAHPLMMTQSGDSVHIFTVPGSSAPDPITDPTTGRMYYNHREVIKDLLLTINAMKNEMDQMKNEMDQMKEIIKKYEYESYENYYNSVAVSK